tara:strand:- start:4927 stop:6012 length:1086 start_codon:yes stop_codon:yes gene_type:complete
MALCGVAGLFSKGISAEPSQHQRLYIFPEHLSGPISLSFNELTAGIGEVSDETIEPCAVTVFHTGTTGLLNAPASSVDTHNFVCESENSVSASGSDSGELLAQGWHGQNAQSITLTEARTSPGLFARLVENWSTETHPVKAHGFALITCVLNDPSALSAAVTTTELCRKAGFWTYALVSRGKHIPEMERAKSIALQQLRTFADGVIEASHEEVLAVCGASDQRDPEFSNEGDYLCRVASILTDSVQKTSNVDNRDILTWIGKGGSAHFRRLCLPPDFRNARRKPLEAYAREMGSWLRGHTCNAKCLILSPMRESDGTSLVGIASNILDGAEESLGLDQNILAFEPNGYHSTLELLVLADPA